MKHNSIESLLEEANVYLKAAVANNKPEEAAYWRGCIHGLYQVVQEANAIHGKRERR